MTEAFSTQYDPAIAQVHQAVAKVQFEGCYYRRDIAHRALKPKE